MPMGTTGRTADGRVAARRWREDHALAIMAHLEQAVAPQDDSPEPGGTVRR